jgi:hypothetical protein
MIDAGLHVMHHLAIAADVRCLPEELMFVVGCWLRPNVAVLHVVREFTFQAISSREQGSTGLDR